MAFDFPNSPTIGDLYTPAGGPTWRFDEQQLWSLIDHVDIPLVGAVWMEYKQQAEDAFIDASVNAITLAGYYDPGDGGASLYKKVLFEPVHVAKLQSADGAWWELAETTITPYMFGARGDNVTDDVVALQAFFDYAVNTKKVDVVCVGNFQIGAKLRIGNGSSSLTRAMHFDCYMTTTYTSNEEAVHFDNTDRVQCTGEFRLYCGPTTYTDRRQWDGILINSVGRETLPNISVEGCKRTGVRIVPNSNGASFDHLTVSRCGGQFAGTTTTGGTAWVTSTDYAVGATIKTTGNRYYVCTTDPGAGLSTVEPTHASGQVIDPGDNYGWTYTGANNGTVNSINQTTTLTVTGIPEILDTTDILVIGGVPYLLKTITRNIAPADTTTGTIDVYPWVIGLTAGPITYMAGGGVHLNGVDTSIMQIGMIDTVTCGIGFKNMASYPPVVQMLHIGSGNGIGMRLGSSSWIGGMICNFYCEQSTTFINLVEAAESNGAGFFIGAGTFTIAQCFKIYTNDGVNHTRRYLRTSFGNVPEFGIDARPLSRAGNPGGNFGGSAVAPPFAGTMQSFTSKHSDTQSVNIAYDDAVNRLFGLDTVFLLATGTGARRNPTGTWTFVPPAGWTIVGTSVFSGMSQPTLFSIHYLIASLQVYVTPVTRRLDTVSAEKGNTGTTVVMQSTESTIVYGGTALTIARTVALPTTGVLNGDRLRVIRKASATGSPLDVGTGPLKTLTPGTWCDVEYDGTAWVLSAYGILTPMEATATVDPGSLALAASSAPANITVTGAALGDIVHASFSLSQAGISLHAYVSAANTVSYYFRNDAGTNPLDLASGTLKVRIEK